jgi:hypothetical protein
MPEHGLKVRLSSASAKPLVFQIEPEGTQFSIKPGGVALLTFSDATVTHEIECGDTADPIFGRIFPEAGSLSIELDGVHLPT